MRTVPSSELQRKLGEVQDAALKEPVAITRNGRDHLVLLSVEEYRRLKKRDREVLRVEALSDEDLEVIMNAKMPPGREHLNAELRKK